MMARSNQMTLARRLGPPLSDSTCTLARATYRGRRLLRMKVVNGKTTKISPHTPNATIMIAV
jgi:hypothetical protein